MELCENKTFKWDKVTDQPAMRIDKVRVRINDMEIKIFKMA